VKQQYSHKHAASHYSQSEAIPEHAPGSYPDTLVLACLLIIAKGGISHLLTFVFRYMTSHKKNRVPCYFCPGWDYFCGLLIHLSP
jgi:hypothetical protein